ncbi:hypothetical protein SALBM135S_01816 [Streptomyces alboniger]
MVEGFAAEAQRRSALQAVEEKRLSSSVSVEPQCGQRIERLSGTGPSVGCERGGAMPNSASLRRPSALMSSVVQAGESTVRTETSAMPCSCSTCSMSAVMASIAGQPV